MMYNTSSSCNSGEYSDLGSDWDESSNGSDVDGEEFGTDVSVTWF